jgi:four helix bundle protein
MESYRQLEVWQLAIDLSERCYRATMKLPPTEIFGLRAQLRKSAVSIPSNIAEGHSRRSTGAYLHHLAIASGSHAELETQLELCRRLGLLKGEEIEAVCELTRTVGRLLGGLIRSLERLDS